MRLQFQPDSAHTAVHSALWPQAPGGGTQVVKYDPQAQVRVEQQQGVLRLVSFVKEMRGPARLPAILSLHEMAGSGAATASDIISQHGMVRLKRPWPPLPRPAALPALPLCEIWCVLGSCKLPTVWSGILTAGCEPGLVPGTPGRAVTILG